MERRCWEEILLPVGVHTGPGCENYQQHALQSRLPYMPAHPGIYNRMPQHIYPGLPAYLPTVSIIPVKGCRHICQALLPYMPEALGIPDRSFRYICQRLPASMPACSGIYACHHIHTCLFKKIAYNTIINYIMSL